MAVAKEVLYVEDDTIDQLAFKRIISKDPRIHYTLINTVGEVPELLDQKSIDLLITDYYLHDGTALEVLHLSQGIPSVVVSGTIKSEEKEVLKRLGAMYYLGKPLIPGTFLTLIQELLFGPPLPPADQSLQSEITIDIPTLRSLYSAGPESEIYFTEMVIKEIPQALSQLESGLTHYDWEEITKVLDILIPKLKAVGFLDLASLALGLSREIKLQRDTKLLEKGLTNLGVQLAKTTQAASHIFPQL